MMLPEDLWVFEDIADETVPRVPSRLGYSPMVPRSFLLGGSLSISRGIGPYSEFSENRRCFRLRIRQGHQQSLGLAGSIVGQEGLMFDKVPRSRLGRYGVLPFSGAASI
jgi:hypothetical protein